MSGDRQPLGGASKLPAAYSANTRAVVMPVGSILPPGGPPFERSQISQALIDVLCLGSLSLLICSLATAIGLFGYVGYLKFFGQV